MKTNLVLIFKEIGWIGTNVPDKWKRTKYWDAILDHVFERMGQKRTCSVTSTTVFANGEFREAGVSAFGND